MPGGKKVTQQTVDIVKPDANDGDQKPQTPADPKP